MNKTFFLMASALATLMGSLSVGCAEKEFPARRAFLFGPTEKHFSVGDYGDIPALNATNEPFEPLVGTGGRMTQGTVTEAAKFIADSTKNLTCDLKAGDGIFLVGKKGDFFLVDLATPCVIEGKEYNEGYVKSAVVEIKVSEGASGESVPVPNSSAATAGNSSASGNSSSSSQSADDNLGCERVSQVVIGDGVVSQAPVGYVPVVPLSRGGVRTAARPGVPISDIRSDGCSNYLSALASTSGCAIPGNVFRHGGVTGDHSELGLTVEGGAQTFRIEVKFDGKSIKQTQLSAAEFKTGDKKFLIPVRKFLPDNDRNGGGGTPGSFIVTALNGNGETVGRTCEHKFRVVSPIVLDLSGLGRFDGISAVESTVRFDLLNNGERVQTGWLKPTMGLLALDRNGNGRIDHGGELFGEATRLANGVTAGNGYEALAALDTNRDGVIDNSDKLFKRLVVWVDANSDGVSQAQEIHPLASLEITRLGLSYSPSLRHGNASLFNNDVRFESRYWGPETCGAKGCLSFDVYFSTVSSVAKR